MARAIWISRDSRLKNGEMARCLRSCRSSVVAQKKSVGVPKGAGIALHAILPVAFAAIPMSYGPGFLVRLVIR